MYNFKRSCVMAALMLSLLSACSSHCTCPPATPPGSTTIIREPAE